MNHGHILLVCIQFRGKRK